MEVQIKPGFSFGVALGDPDNVETCSVVEVKDGQALVSGPDEVSGWHDVAQLAGVVAEA